MLWVAYSKNSQFSSDFLVTFHKFSRTSEIREVLQKFLEHLRNYWNIVSLHFRNSWYISGILSISQKLPLLSYCNHLIDLKKKKEPKTLGFKGHSTRWEHHKWQLYVLSIQFYSKCFNSSTTHNWLHSISYGLIKLYPEKRSAKCDERNC